MTADRVPETRTYDHDRDVAAIVRIWREIRWLKPGSENEQALADLIADADAEVGIADGQPECFVHRTPGVITYDTTPLPLCVISAVTTSQIGRKQGFATTLTARAVRLGADAGAAVAALGMFEQGFYNRFGFGTGGYDHFITFDPSTLRVDHIPYRVPVRLGADDRDDLFQAIQARHRHHCAVTLEDPPAVSTEIVWADHPLTLGYRDDSGRLTHFFFGELADGNGPLRLRYVIYETPAQLMELLRLLRELGDQIHAVKIPEPAELSLQTLIDAPLRQRNRSRKSDLASGIESIAWWQLRVLDVERCVAARRWVGAPIEFVLELSDPIAGRLARAGFTDGWLGVGGTYAITVGAPSRANVVTAADGDALLPTLSTDVGTFSRLWFGVESTTALQNIGALEAPDELCVALDAALRLPRAVTGLPF